MLIECGAFSRRGSWLDLGSATVLTLHSVSAETMVSAIVSAYGIRAAVLQKIDGEWMSVAYASRVLTADKRKQRSDTLRLKRKLSQYAGHVTSFIIS